MEFKVFLFVILAVIVTTVEGQLRCYICSFSSVDTDRSCLTITNSTETINCPATFCTIMRQEFIDPPGQISSFLRGCEEYPDYTNHEIVDPTFRTFYRACTRDLCNIGNGVQSVVGGGLSPRPQYDGKNLLVRGTATGGANTRPKINILIYLTIVIVIITLL